MTSTLDPLALFREWFEAAAKTDLPEPSAVALATVGADGRPSARMVLARGVDAHGIVFYTNAESRKGRELGGAHGGGAPVSLCFYWPPLARQVRIEGIASPVSGAEADRYWASRPRAHQVAAWASPQSRPLPGGRDELARHFEEMDRKLPQTNVPRPPHWTGFRVVPAAIEFWQGRDNRLHDRTLYTRHGDGWKAVTLGP
ncbi:MAG: pyridoxamine 5'-phosphate oxidase [Candidatus Eiseniibacteriota bacterium]